jgi:hypothetical protein
LRNQAGIGWNLDSLFYFFIDTLLWDGWEGESGLTSGFDGWDLTFDEGSFVGSLS